MLSWRLHAFFSLKISSLKFFLFGLSLVDIFRVSEGRVLTNGIRWPISVLTNLYQTDCLNLHQKWLFVFCNNPGIWFWKVFLWLLTVCDRPPQEQSREVLCNVLLFSSLLSPHLSNRGHFTNHTQKDSFYCIFTSTPYLIKHDNTNLLLYLFKRVHNVLVSLYGTVDFGDSENCQTIPARSPKKPCAPAQCSHSNKAL